MKKAGTVPILLGYCLLFWVLLPAGLFALGKRIDVLFDLRQLRLVAWAFIPLILLGALLCFTSARELMTAGSGFPVFGLPPRHHVDSGPYFYVRHPLYIGLQLLLLGIGFVLASPGCLLASGPFFLLLWLGYALLYKDKLLLKRFGPVYKRYRRETGLLFPSLYTWTIFLLYLLFRILFGLRIMGSGRVPKRGPFFLISLHRSYLDPFVMALGLRRKVHYLATSVLFRHARLALFFKKLGCIPIRRSRADLRSIWSAIKVIDSGGIIGLFPEGGRSWYGETACDPAVFKLLQKRRIPLVTAELSGGFELFPRISRLPRLRKLRLEYRAYPPGRVTPQQLIQQLVVRERRVDALTRALTRPQPAEGAEALIYICPECSAAFRCTGYADGTLRCAGCGSRFTLVEGKGLQLESGKCLSLPEVEKRNLRWLSDFDHFGLVIPVSVFHGRVPRRTGRLGNRRRSRSAIRELRSGKLSLFPHHITAEYAGGERKAVYYEEIQSVLIESNRKLEISYRSEARRNGYFHLLPPIRYALFLQHFLRLKAFGNPYARYRGSRRFDLQTP